MKNSLFYILDVFAEQKYAGNQLAVIRGTEGLESLVMQKIARETNFSETSFIISEQKRNRGFDVRIFTPQKELPFAGHPTLGTAYVIRKEIAKTRSETIVLNLKAGQIPVTFGETDILWMRQLSPVFGRYIEAKRVAKTLGLKEDEIDMRFPIQEVSTGLPFLMVPLKSLSSAKRAKINHSEYSALVEGLDAKGILVFSPETYRKDNNLNVRAFADLYGVGEDPATGSANGCLAGYLVKYRYFGKDLIDIRVEQGYEIGRPSLLFLKAQKNKDKIDVQVGGKVIMIAKGELL